MKTRTQVIQWLKDNSLYEIVGRKLPIPVEKHPMQDIDLHEFFVTAFDWKYTSEGEDFWKKINKDFLDWYGPVTTDESKKKKKK